MIDSCRLGGAWRDRFHLTTRSPSFDAVHVSPDGKDLVVMCSDPCCIVYIQDFARREEEEESLLSFRINVGQEDGVSLAFDGRRILFGYLDEDECSLFVLTLDDIRKSISDWHCNPTLIKFTTFDSLTRTSCMQLTDTGIWLVYQLPVSSQVSPSIIMTEYPDLICYVDMRTTVKVIAKKKPVHVQDDEEDSDYHSYYR
ncbi:hypothetical protein FRC02_010335 [Tulasnella sp. 418]|nr:hypothetical protein FRC02_010335 [Tulasnella sp. 418]